MKSLNGAAVLAAWSALAAGGAAHAQEAVQWRVEDGGNGHWYECIRVLEGVNWHDANSACEARGGHLATIHSSAENQIVFSLIGPGSTWPMRFGPWLGGLETPSGWAWVTGEAWTWTNWMPGEPNNVCPLGEDRLHYIEYGDQWNDLYHTGYCGTEGPTWGYMAEWSADCNGDGIVDYGQILDGTFEDVDSNGVPDCCDQGVSCDPCVGDVNFDGIVNGADISVLLGFWGLNGKPVAADINKDGQVDGTDLANVLGSWGACP